MIHNRSPRSSALLHAASIFAAFLWATACAQVLEYGEPRKICELADLAIRESSGLASSALNRNVFWTHNDNRGDSRLFAFDSRGQTVAMFRIKDIDPVDMEDMAHFQMEGKSYLLLADTGDNYRQRRVLSLYIIEEPEIRKRNGELPLASRIDFRYPDGPRDCEAVAVDATSNLVLLVTKPSKDEESELYSLPFSLSPGKEALVATKLTSLKIRGITSMDLSPDGKRMALLAYRTIWELTREEGESWAHLFEKSPRRLATLPIGQWEGISYAPDGLNLYVTREKLPAVLMMIPCREGGKEK